jgi:hypothetical protein
MSTIKTLCGGMVWALLLALAGCGSGKYVPVSGQLMFSDGTPATGLEGRQVVFEPVGSGEIPEGQSTGAIDAQGKFTMGTEALGDGVPAGMHRVLISEATATGDVPPPPIIDPKYNRFETSGLQYEVKAGGPPPEFKLDKAK